jgi:hypothetical protein
VEKPVIPIPSISNEDRQAVGLPSGQEPADLQDLLYPYLHHRPVGRDPLGADG